MKPAAPQRPGLRGVVVAWAPAVLYMVAIFTVSSLPARAEWVSEFPWKDKGIHFLEFLLLGLLVALACHRTWPSRQRLRTTALAFLIAISWGFLDELHQAFVPSRSADIDDFIADAAGAAMGTTLGWMIAVFRSRRSAEPAATDGSSTAS